MVCKTCGAEMEPTRKWQKFCSAKCRMFHHNQHRAVIRMDDELSDDDKKTIMKFLDAAEKDPSMWVKLAKKLEEKE